MDESLKTILIRTKGAAAGIFLAAAVPELLSSRLDQAGIDRTRDAWAAWREHLCEGRPVTGHNYHVWGIESTARGTPLIYIGADGPLRVSVVRDVIQEESECLAFAIECDKTEGGLSRAETAAVNRYLSSAPLDAVAKRTVEAHLERDEGNISRAAQRLGISRTTLYQHLERFNIPRSHGRKTTEPR
jgi:hypothetical protein